MIRSTVASLWIMAALVGMAYGASDTADQGELLYNGIRLPAEWPPRDMDQASLDPMPVPYLEHPPAVIPIDVGRQLFVDDFLIENTDLKRVFHTPTQDENNPVITAEPDKPELEHKKGAATANTNHGGFFYDPRDKVFKLFYSYGLGGALVVDYSKDLVHWDRPELTPDRGNVVRPAQNGDHAIWLDLNASEPDERLKYLVFDHRRQGSHMLDTSAEGVEWTERAETRRAGDYCSFFYNPFRDVWVYSIKHGKGERGRRRFYREGRDFVADLGNWSYDSPDIVFWTAADRLDKPEPEGSYHPAAHDHGTQLYSLDAVAYESVMVGVHQILRGPWNGLCSKEKFPKLCDLELGFSRDGFHWSRPEARTPFLAGTRKDGDWNRAYLHTMTGVFGILDDKLVFPYTGFSGMAPDGSRGVYHGGSIGLAWLRRDGFASMDAGQAEGSLTTRPVRFKGKYMFVNVDCPEGELRAELLDENDQPIAPFTLAKSNPVKTDSTLHHMTWKGAEDLAALAGKPVKIRFTLTNGELYAFWVSPDKSGASYGYVGAGGPGFPGVRDTVGRAASEPAE
jgi:hypothetical protein